MAHFILLACTLFLSHTKARGFNFARCQRFLIKSQNTIPAFRGSGGDQNVPGRARIFFFWSILPFVKLPAEPQGWHMALLHLLFEKITTPQCCLSFNSAVFMCISLLISEILLQNSAPSELPAISCNNSSFFRLGWVFLAIFFFFGFPPVQDWFKKKFFGFFPKSFPISDAHSKNSALGFLKTHSQEHWKNLHQVRPGEIFAASDWVKSPEIWQIRFGCTTLWITSVLVPSGPVSSASDPFVILGFFWYKNVTFYQKKTKCICIFLWQEQQITCNPLFEQLGSFLRKRSTWFAWSKKGWNQAGIKNYTRYLKKLFCAHFSFGVVWEYLSNAWNLVVSTSHGYIYNLFRR